MESKSMDMEAMSRLSFYRELTPLGNKENISLVKHIENDQIYVRKILDTYDADIYKLIQNAHVQYVPQIYECIESDGKLYVIEEYIQGITLEKYIDEYGILNENTSCWVIECLCQIIEHFHSLPVPVIHRDIKPANVILKGVFSNENVDIQGVYLIDFNTARQYDEYASRDTTLMGTRGFAAPEQYGFSQSDARTDIYALGILLNYMLTGHIANDCLYHNDPEIMRIIKISTDMSPDRRYQKVSFLAADLYSVMTKSAGYSIHNKVKKTMRRFLPPGFRTVNVGYMLAGGLFYIVLLWFCITITVTDGKTGKPVTGYELAAYRVVYFIMFFGLALLWGNYLNIWRYIPLLRNEKRSIRVVGVILYSVIWVFLVVVWFAIIDGIFKM